MDRKEEGNGGIEIRNMQYNYIKQGDCLELMKDIPDKSIDCVITSPPYFNLRDYGVVGQIGMENTVEEYLKKLLLVFTEIHRVLKDSGSCWVNINDVYIKQSLASIPDRFKIKMIESGWLCRNEIIWHKPNAMPSSAKNRFNNDYEKLYFFTKRTKYYFETQYEPFKSPITKNTPSANTGKYESVVQEKKVRQGMSKSRGSKTIAVRKNLPKQKDFVDFLRSRTNIRSLVENSQIKKSTAEHWFRYDDVGFSYPTVEDWNGVKWLIDDFSPEFMKIDNQLNDVTFETDAIMKNSNNGRIKRAVWSINTKPFKGCHFAPYPEALIVIPILACCPENGVVLDPFMGSGTTGVVCMNNKRNFIGIELNEKYCEIAQKRINDAMEGLT